MNYLKCLRYYIEELYHKVTMYIKWAANLRCPDMVFNFPKKNSNRNKPQNFSKEKWSGSSINKA